jgi:hypothetical protein
MRAMAYLLLEPFKDDRKKRGSLSKKAFPINTFNRSPSTLALLVPGIRADDVDHAAPAHDLAVLADLLH